LDHSADCCATVLSTAASRAGKRLRAIRELRGERRRDAARMAQEHVILEADDRFMGSGIALASAAAEQLPVDATRLVEFGEDHVQARRVRDVARQRDVGSRVRPCSSPP
jgi:adenylate kinase